LAGVRTAGEPAVNDGGDLADDRPLVTAILK
jgi:hypothetical protein